MKKITLTGKTLTEAKAEFLKLSGEDKLSPQAEQMFENLALTDDGVIASMIVEVHEKGELDKMTQDEKLEAFNQRMDAGEDFEEVAFQLFGPPPAYNGVVGDSHDCPACNYRRAQMGPDILTDMKAGMFPEQAKAAVKAGYAKDGRLVPNEALHPTRHSEAAREKNLEMVPGARRRMVSLFGEGSQELKDFDGMVEAYKAGDANAEAMKKLDSLRAKVFSLI